MFIYQKLMKGSFFDSTTFQFCLNSPQDRDAGGPAETTTRFPPWCSAPAPVPTLGAHNGPNAYTHANTEPAAHTATGIQGAVVGLTLLRLAFSSKCQLSTTIF